VALEFRTVLVELRDGATHVGFVRERNASEMKIAIASGQTVTLPIADIANEKSLPGSLMPEGLLQGLTPQEAADALAYLIGLK
jgi:putative heme-binding domain-containing protein